MRILYVRVSMAKQNPARQYMEGFDRVFTDHISGAAPFMEREGGQELTALVKTGVVTEVHAKDIDRIGRDIIDVLHTLKFLSKAGVVVHIESIGASHIDGKENPVFNLMVGILATVAEMERKKIRERSSQGIAIAKAAGKFKGRRIGTVIPRDKFLEKYKAEARIVKANQTLSIAKLMKLTGRGKDLTKKIKDYII